ncbi:MAG: hypothetical protein M1839_004312, partial [Geoglossum umbratile]
ESIYAFAALAFLNSPLFLVQSLLPPSVKKHHERDFITRKKAKTALAMTTDGTHAKFLYPILKQLDLKSIDWNLVASLCFPRPTSA